MFDQESTDSSCVISYELAILNELAVGDTITVHNPSKEDQTYTLTVCGIFQNETTDSYSNTIFTTYSSLDAIVEDTAKKCRGSHKRPWQHHQHGASCIHKRNLRVL